MQRNGIIAILVAFFLVTASSWAAACELSCSLEASHCECPSPQKADTHAHPHMTPVCMNSASGELSGAVHPLQSAVNSAQSGARCASGCGSLASLTTKHSSRTNSSPPEKLSPTPALFTLRI